MLHFGKLSRTRACYGAGCPEVMAMAEPKADAIRILCVDDHPLLREGIAAVIEGQSDMLLVGEAANMKELSETTALDASGPPD